MAGKRLTPVFTQNFAETLDAIRTFLGDDGRQAFDRLVDRLLDDVVPTVCRFPSAGRSFLAQPVGSLEARSAVRRLKRSLQPHDEVREFIFDDYLLLYLVRGTRVFFLSVKHHRQLSFDLSRFWP
jgi:plasmid stabilization system protein ParE